MKDPVLPEKADYLIMECTYGDKPHRDPEEAFAEFRQVVMKTIRRKGKVIIPAFAVGRTQELVFDLNRMLADGDIPPIPVYVDSPLAVNATDIFRKFNDLFDQETQAFIQENRHPALSFPSLTYTRSVKESKEINDKEGPMVIISASGMAEAGRILHHLRHNIDDERNTIMIVSWQAPGTRGRRLAEKKREIKIFGEKFYRQAEVATIGGLSAHAGQDFLLEYARAAGPGLKNIFLVHGEENAAEALMSRMDDSVRENTFFPRREQVIDI
jgi:metallo-beta-lactamase family protein